MQVGQDMRRSSQRTLGPVKLPDDERLRSSGYDEKRLIVRTAIGQAKCQVLSFEDSTALAVHL